jgi:hypothetical protein
MARATVKASPEDTAPVHHDIIHQGFAADVLGARGPVGQRRVGDAMTQLPRND